MRSIGFRFALFLISSCYVLTGQDSHPLAAKYMGPGSCAAPSCHGGVQPRTETSVLQNEYSTWVVKDKFHTKAFAVLSNDIGQRVGRILGLPHPETAQKCLVCHSLDAAPNQTAKTLDKQDG